MTIAFDTETHLFRPGVMAPEIVCLSYQWDQRAPVLLDYRTAEGLLDAWLNPRVTSDVMVGHNVAYDWCVIAAQWPDFLPRIFDAYDADRVTDTMYRQKLLDIAAGHYKYRPSASQPGRMIPTRHSLDACFHRATGGKLNKPPTAAEIEDGVPDTSWQKRYGQLREIPVHLWEPEARDYALEDAAATMAVYRAQEEYADPYLRSQFRLTRRAFWLQLMSVWGLRTDADAVEALRGRTEQARDEIAGHLRDAGLVRKDGSRDTKAAVAHMLAVCARDGLEVRRNEPTEKMLAKGIEEGNVKLDADTCLATGDSVLEDYAEYTTLGYILSKDVKALAQGTIYPIHTHWGLAETERVTSSNPNVQNWSRRVGPRETFRPRAGRIFWDADYGQIELHTLAQICIKLFGHSALAQALNSGIDPHASMAAEFMGRPYEWIIANKHDPEVQQNRQAGKVFNFGSPGGLGPDKMVMYARKTYGVILTRAQCVEYKAAWLGRWPEMSEYFAWANERMQEAEANDWIGAQVVCPFTGSIRGGTHYCNTCNTPFQRLAASCATEAGWLLAKACYVDESSVLYGDRPVFFGHDQWIAEMPDVGEGGAAHLREAMRLMKVGADKYLPDVPCKVDGQLERVWSKKAHGPIAALDQGVDWVWDPSCPCKDCQKEDT